MQTLANCVAVVFILHFFWSYYRNCYRRGYRIDLWHFSIFQALLITSVMLPFSRSPLNVISFGPVLLKRALPWVDTAYLISALGYGSFILGGSLWRLNLGLGLRQTFSHILDQPVRLSLMLLRARRLLLLLGAFALTLIGIVLAFYFKTAGFGLNLSSILIVTPALRPLAQFGAFIAIMIGTAAFARFQLYGERSMLLLGISLCIAMMFYGARGLLLAIIQLPVLIWLIRLRTRLKLPWLALMLFVAFFLSVFLDALRRPGFSISRVLLTAGMSVAFGNSFSDTRDFALILSFWNGHFWLGKTYLAGLIAFVPRFLSEFRDTWAIGVVTATMAGFEPTQHPGIRVGASGEAYLNFGLVAVVLVGLFGGAITRLIDLRIKESIARDPRDIRVYAYLILGSFAGVAANSVGFSSLYTSFLLLFFAALLIAVSRFLKLPLA